MPDEENATFFIIANVCFPAEAVYGPLVVVISRISDTFGIGSRFGSPETLFLFLSLSLAPKEILTRAFPFLVPQCRSEMRRWTMTFVMTSEMKKTKGAAPLYKEIA